MAVAKRGKHYYLRVRLFGGKVQGVKTPAKTKAGARQIEMTLMTACRSGDYRALDPVSREVCVRLFKNQGWEIPPDLRVADPVEELTLWRATEIFLKYPQISKCSERSRYEQCLVHLIEHFGQDQPVKSIWVPEIRRYMDERLDEGASPSTVNREKGTLSKAFQVLIEQRLAIGNPCRLVKNLSQKCEEREVYLSHEDAVRVLELCPDWLQSIVATAYYTGMRRGEVLGLSRRQVRLSQRMLLLGPEDTKEGRWKRVPIHLDLAPILEEVMKVQSLGTDRVFLVKGRSPNRYSLRKPWRKAVGHLNLEIQPRFHDLRHTWKTNARRSGMDPEIRESIMGHWYRGRNVNERYGRIGDEELIGAIDAMSFDHGETEILVARRTR